MPILQTRIFVNSDEPNDWVETLLGRIIKPITTEFNEHLEWFWFSRYASLSAVEGEDRGDCEIEAIPEICKRPIPGTNGQAFHRSVRFRFEIAAEAKDNFETRLRALIGDFGYAISDVRPYDELSDTGGPRFLATENRSDAKAQLRARLVSHVFCTSSRLLLDMLIGPDANGRFRVESNDFTAQNPNFSSLESVHHIFWNLTAVPLSVLIKKEGENAGLYGTYWGPFLKAEDKTIQGQQFTEVFLRY